MATRIHVAAARNTSASEFRQALARALEIEPEGLKVGQAGGWCSLVASVWTVAGSKLDDGLRALSGPTLRITSEDASRWYLNLFAKGQEPFFCCHEFSMVEPTDEHAAGEDSFEVVEEMTDLSLLDEDDEDDELPDFLGELDEDEKEPDPRSPFDEIAEEFEFLGYRLPEELRERTEGLDFRDTVEELFQWQAETVADALARFGVPHNRDEIVATLTGQTVTQREWDTDLGNLPRFLHGVGLGQCVALPEETEDEYDEGSEDEGQAECVTPVLERAGGLKAVPIQNGPVQRPLTAAHHVFRIPWFCDSNVDAALVVELPPGAKFNLHDAGLDWIQVHKVDDRLQIGIFDATDLLLPSAATLGERLAGLPNGSVVELVTSGEDMQSGNQRYRGTVRDGTWCIEETYPPVSRDVLSAALALSQQAEQDDAFAVESDEEAEAVLEAAAHHDAFGDTPPRRKGLELRVHRAQRDWLAMLFFRRRFRDTWDVQAGEARDERAHEEWERFIEDLEQTTAAPRSDEMVLAGKMSRFLRSDMDSLSNVDSEALATTDRAMKNLGMEHLGDLVCEKYGEVIVRGYGAPDGEAYGVHMQGTMGQCEWEFYTAFDDGSSLTTTTTEETSSSKRRKIYYRSHPDLDVEPLFREHRRGIDKFREQGVAPCSIDPTLAGLARAIDAFLQRQLVE